MIGIILLDTKFPRLLGDIGNPETFPFPVGYEKVEGAIPARIIKDRDPLLLLPFLEAAKNLEKRGAKAITTTCGFLSIWQKEMASAVSIPVLTSSLIQVPWAYQMAGRRGRVGVLTAEAPSLTAKHFEGVGAKDIPIKVRGMDPHGEFHRIYVENQMDMNQPKAEREVISEITALIDENPDVTTIVLECTNLSVFRKAIREKVNLPLFDIFTLVHFIRASLA